MKSHVENTFAFRIGDTVVASRRKVPPLNEEGGVARVTNIHLAAGQASYDVQYVLDCRKENRLDISILTRHDMIDGDKQRPHRSKKAAIAGKKVFHHQQIFLKSISPIS